MYLSKVTGCTLGTGDIMEYFHALGTHPALIEKLINAVDFTQHTGTIFKYPERDIIRSSRSFSKTIQTTV